MAFDAILPQDNARLQIGVLGVIYEAKSVGILLWTVVQEPRVDVRGKRGGVYSRLVNFIKVV